MIKMRMKKLGITTKLGLTMLLIISVWSGGVTKQSVADSTMPGLFPEVVAGATHSFALFSDDRYVGWGRNDLYQLGISSTIPVLKPRPMTGMSDISSIATGVDHTLIVKTDGTVYGFGINHTFQANPEIPHMDVTKPTKLHRSAM